MKEPDLILNMKEAANKDGPQTQPQQQQTNNKKQQQAALIGDSPGKSKKSHHHLNNNNSNNNNNNNVTTTPPSTNHHNHNSNHSNKKTQQSPVAVENGAVLENTTATPKINGPIPPAAATVIAASTSTPLSQPSSMPATPGGDEIAKSFNLSDKISVLKCNNQIKELHTVLRDKETSHSDFKFYSDRLIRLLVEESLNQLPYSSQKVITPADCEYEGIKYIKGVCGVSIMRSGEAMEKGLRECCRSIRIGKILIQSSDEDHKKSSVVYAKFPSDIISRKILLMYPITTSGSTVNLAIRTLKEHGVAENNILVLCLFSTPNGLQSVSSLYPDVHILTSEIYPSVPTDFGQRYFGTE